MTITRPGAQRSTTSAGQASPTTTSDAAESRSGESIATADGVWVNTLTSSPASTSCSSSGERVTSSGTTTSRPPRSSAPKISHTETSNAYEWHCDHTPDGGRPASSDPNSCVTLRCVTATPLGTPVVPEV
ncbi:hypothetical protein MINTM019_27480 [Mycobacterium paraintracellulare]|uniref:Uncharacterized protein n=1 Tax=Mycobacterium paraintracellulare TaxID=1138383 RepID=A0ABM7KE27_9MYCO|nr:hypothetical protein MPRI_46190 [Mycobacterium paraintracellulare]BCO84400.1 hypothetical protein MINTM011_27350 [Mycobacterium paraintracellulare]BCP05292.1 hypothetical protein MINTM019_27480 [Mycobacterium paraintracellulare]